jgi:hypothetical protein
MKSKITTIEHNEAGAESGSPSAPETEVARLLSKLPNTVKDSEGLPATRNAKITTINHIELGSPHGQEVEFALLISKLIDTVQQDPEQLRLTIYDFARAKLKNDLSWANESEREGLLSSLETAIHGVEKFSRSDQLQWLSPPTHAEQPALLNFGTVGPNNGFKREVPELIDVSATARPAVWPKRGAKASSLPWFAFGGLLAGSVIAGSVYLMRGNPVQTTAPAAQQNASHRAADAAPQAQPPPQTSPGFPIPGDYGVYALNEGKLNELSVLPEQVPDKRVAMSTPVTQPSRTTLPNGRTKFIVYRRDLGNNAPERVDVRVVAQVARALTFDSKGKPTSAPVNGAWNIRNITHEFRVRPVAGNAEMLLIQPENAAFELPAGRYVLVLKNQGYDFTVAGPVTDPSQCLERTEAANGTFYSDCKKL